MRRKKLLFALNPHAGRGAVRDYLVDLVDEFVHGGYDVTVHTSQKPQELLGYIEENAGGYDMLASCGGDGTLHETVNGLMRCEKKPSLCYIPAGTVNDFASSLGIPRDPLAAGRLVEEGFPFPYDVGRFGEQFFSYVAAFGAFTQVSYQTPQQAKLVFGRLAYIAEGVRELSELIPYRLRVRCQEAELEGDFLYGMVSNSTSVAGLKLPEEKIRLNDGLFEVFLIRFPRNRAERQAIFNGLMKREAAPEMLHVFQTSKVEMTSEGPLPWTLDGEFGGDVRQVKIENCPGAIKVLVNREAGPPTESSAENEK